MKNKVALDCVHISGAQRSEHLVVAEILYDGLKSNSWHYRCSRKFTPTGMESFDQRLGSEMTAAIQILEFPKFNWHTIASATYSRECIGSASICFSCFLCPYLLPFLNWLETECSNYSRFCCSKPGLHSTS